MNFVVPSVPTGAAHYRSVLVGHSAGLAQVPPGAHTQGLLKNCIKFIPSAVASVQLETASLLLQFCSFSVFKSGEL